MRRQVTDNVMSTTTGTNHTPKGPVTILGEAYVGQTLIARPNGVSDADGIDTSTISFQWLRDGQIIQDATNRTYDVAIDDVDARLSVRYTYVDFGGTLEILTSDQEPVVPPAGTPIPTDTGPYNPLMVLGNALVGENLIARPNAVTDANGINPSTITYQWLRDGTPISGATAQTYAVSDADIDAQLTVQFSYSDLFGTAKTLTSNPRPPVAEPIVEVPPPAPLPRESDVRNLNGTMDDDILQASFGLTNIYGFGGSDTVAFNGKQSGYKVVIAEDSVTVLDHRAFGLGAITLDNVELIQFATTEPVFDGPLDLDSVSGLAKLGQQDAASIIELYIAYFNRAPDAIGLNFWGTAFANGVSLSEMAVLFADQNETRATYPDGTTNSDFANSVYTNILGRTPDQTGLTFWTDALDTGAVSRDELILRVLEGARASLQIERGPDFVTQQLADRTYLENKIDIGAFFAVHRGMSDVANAEFVMDLHDGTSGSIIAAVDKIDAFYREALDPNDGEFLLQVVGVMDSPFLA